MYRYRLRQQQSINHSNTQIEKCGTAFIYFKFCQMEPSRTHTIYHQQFGVKLEQKVSISPVHFLYFYFWYETWLYIECHARLPLHASSSRQIKFIHHINPYFKSFGTYATGHGSPTTNIWTNIMIVAVLYFASARGTVSALG